MTGPGEAPSVQQRELSLAECLPENWNFLEIYQQEAATQVVKDDNGHTIRGMEPRVYMFEGLLEELDELLHDNDRVEPAYQRLGALMLMPDNPELNGGKITPTAVARHIKEFGDVSWYLANLLSTYDFNYLQVIEAGQLAWQLDKVAQPRAEIVGAEEVERLFPWFNLLGYASELRVAITRIAPMRRDGRIAAEKALIISAGKFTLSMIHVAKSRFGISYEAILVGNKAKLEKRMAEGTIFDKTGGDDR